MTQLTKAPASAFSSSIECPPGHGDIDMP